VTTTRELTEAVTKIASPFGGIVYLSAAMDEELPPPMEIKFDGFCMHPRIVAGNPAVWEQTKDLDVPWGEFDAGAVIFTLPTAFMREVIDFEVIADKFKIVVTRISQILALVDVRPYRIVFDVDLPDPDAANRYRLFFLESGMRQAMCSFDAPTPELFEVVKFMALSSLKEGCFDPATELAIGTVTAGLVFQTLFQKFEPLEHEFVGRPPLFQELWLIQSQLGVEVLSQTVTVMQDPEYQRGEVPEDQWKLFVKELCAAGKQDFTTLLERVKPIPRNILRSLSTLPVFGS
jgi:hypothetical protein